MYKTPPGGGEGGLLPAQGLYGVQVACETNALLLWAIMIRVENYKQSSVIRTFIFLCFLRNSLRHILNKYYFTNAVKR